jgi:hypothetical protein
MYIYIYIISEHLDDQNENLEHSKTIAKNLTNLWRQLDKDNQAQTA